MGNLPCIRRENARTCCDVSNSVFGEDAFYRDALYERPDGPRPSDSLLGLPREQAKLKLRKGAILANYASFEVKRRAAEGKAELTSCIAAGACAPSEVDDDSPANLQRRTVGSHEAVNWQGTTLPEWRDDCLPDLHAGPFWSNGGGRGLKVRCGPNYRECGLKADSAGNMYKVLSCDAIKHDSKIEDIMGRLIKDLPSSCQTFAESDRSSGPAPLWEPGCPLPRILCINMMLPHQASVIPSPFGQDPGCSFVGLFEITPETLRALRSKSPPPHIQLFKEFCEGPCGLPGGAKSEPARCLGARVNRKVKRKDQQAGLFKVAALCKNPEDVQVPNIFREYNGKPCLITKCGYVIKDPGGEWLEIGIDVRGFNVLARKMLCSFRSLLPRTHIQYGFMIQGFQDDELPEKLLCDMLIHGVDILEDPMNIGRPKRF